jgi:hypothetical protein
MILFSLSKDRTNTIPPTQPTSLDQPESAVERRGAIIDRSGNAEQRSMVLTSLCVIKRRSNVGRTALHCEQFAQGAQKQIGPHTHSWAYGCEQPFGEHAPSLKQLLLYSHWVDWSQAASTRGGAARKYTITAKPARIDANVHVTFSGSSIMASSNLFRDTLQSK